jgi:hypothetical protein
MNFESFFLKNVRNLKKKINRLRSKTSDPFRAVILNDFNIIVLLETSLMSSFHAKADWDQKAHAMDQKAHAMDQKPPATSKRPPKFLQKASLYGRL